jgi:hypothetical protein
MDLKMAIGIEKVEKVYKVHDIDLNKIKTFKTLEQAEKFVDELQSSFVEFYCLKNLHIKNENKMSFELLFIEDNDEEIKSEYVIVGEIVDNAWVFQWKNDKRDTESQWFSSMNEAIKMAIKNWDMILEKEQEKYYQGMADAYYGTSECSICRGGGCIHCEPNRFI